MSDKQLEQQLQRSVDMQIFKAVLERSSLEDVNAFEEAAQRLFDQERREYERKRRAHNRVLKIVRERREKLTQE